MKKTLHSVTRRILKIIWFSGRINRLEYLISLVFIYGIVPVVSGGFNHVPLFVLLGLFYLQYSQGAKRCQDRNISGFWIIFPLNFFFNFSDKGTDGANEYGEKPKKIFEEKEVFIEEGFEEETDEHPKQDMLYGALLFVGGIVLTVCDTGYIFWGAIVYGGYLFLRGLTKSYFTL